VHQVGFIYKNIRFLEFIRESWRSWIRAS